MINGVLCELVRSPVTVEMGYGMLSLSWYGALLLKSIGTLSDVGYTGCG